jgi:hypothetical protein
MIDDCSGVIQEIIVPDFIPGERANLVAYAIQNYATIEEIPVMIYQNKYGVWSDACSDACEKLGLVNQVDAAVIERVTQKATELIGSLSWWSL